MLQEAAREKASGYAAELQAQIRAKEQQRMQQRNSSLRESQELLAQRMAAPAGLVRCQWPA